MPSTTPTARRNARRAAIAFTAGVATTGLAIAAHEAAGQTPVPAFATVGNVAESGRQASASMAVRVYRTRGIRSVTVTVQIRAARAGGQTGTVWATKTFRQPLTRPQGYGTVTRRCVPGPRVIYLYATVRVRVVDTRGRTIMNRLTDKSDSSTRTACAV